MRCPSCGKRVKKKDRFCPSCGATLSQAVGALQDGVSAKKWHTGCIVVAALLMAVALIVPALMMVGIIPQMALPFDLPFLSGDGDDAQVRDSYASDGEDAVTVPDEDYTGLRTDAVRSSLEGAGFTDVTVETRYCFKVYGNEDRDGLVDRVQIASGNARPDLVAGDTLKEDTPIVITELVAPQRSRIEERAFQESDIYERMSEDQEWFDGTWKGYEIANADTELNNSLCRADTREDLMPQLVIRDANGTSRSFMATLRALVHYHGNDRPRSYSSADDKLEDIGRLAGEGEFVMGPGSLLNHQGTYQFFDDISVKDAEGNEIAHPIKVLVTMANDLNAHDDDYPGLFDELLGDQASQEYASEDDALDAFGAALRASDHVWLQLCVYQEHGRDDIRETYKLKKEEQ